MNDGLLRRLPSPKTGLPTQSVHRTCPWPTSSLQPAFSSENRRTVDQTESTAIPMQR